MADKLVIKNVGTMLSGALEEPILDADTVIVEGGKISAIGKEANLDTGNAATTIDANRTVLSPGLIDSHVSSRRRGLDTAPEPA